MEGNHSTGIIRTKPVPACNLCGGEGKPLYEKLKDRLFGVPGEWNLKRCDNPDCGLVWLDPRPVVEDMGKLYAEYCTHTSVLAEDQGLSPIRKSLLILAEFCGKKAEDVDMLVKFMRKALSRFGPRRENAEAEAMWLTGVGSGRLLDVGCGSGLFLKKMRELGWEVSGVEPDPKAVRVAREEYGLNVWQGDLHDAGFADNSFDAVTLCHVIEHVQDPVGLLKECRRVLKPGGKLVAVTPNIESLGHLKFGSNWRGLEQPRHLHIFSKCSLMLSAVQSGFNMFDIRSVARLAPFIWIASTAIERNEALLGISLNHNGLKGLRAKIFQLIEYIFCRFKSVGEEVVLIASK